MEDEPTTTTVNLERSPDVPPEPAQDTVRESFYSESQLHRVSKQAIGHWFGPRYTEYMTMHARLRSFDDNCKRESYPPRRHWARLGFSLMVSLPSIFVTFDWPYTLPIYCGFFRKTFTSLFLAGWNDGTVCYHCGGALFEWAAADGPWVEYARFFPYCVYLTYVKGPTFIRECTQNESGHAVEALWNYIHACE
jgi:hypothetical protein